MAMLRERTNRVRETRTTGKAGTRQTTTPHSPGVAQVSSKPVKSVAKMNDEELRKLSGERLRTARLKRGLLMRQVTEAMGKHGWENTDNVSRLQGYENGTRALPVITARHLAEILGVSAAYILCVDDTIGIAQDEMDLIVRYKDAPDTVRGMVNQLLRLSVAS